MSPADARGCEAAIGLGANLGNPAAQIDAAIARLAALPDSTLIRRSSLYRSAAMGPPQPDYCNAVVLLRTTLTPDALVAHCKAIEAAAGRDFSAPRWTARILDLDVLVCGALRVDRPGLTVPHPGIAERNFVLVPLAEIAPDLDIPGLGPAAALAGRCTRAGLAPWGELP